MNGNTPMPRAPKTASSKKGFWIAIGIIVILLAVAFVALRQTAQAPDGFPYGTDREENGAVLEDENLSDSDTVDALQGDLDATDLGDVESDLSTIDSEL